MDVTVFANQPNRGKRHIRHYRRIHRDMLVKLCYSDKEIKPELVRVAGDPVENPKTFIYTIDTIYLSYGALHLGKLELDKWGVVPYASGEYESNRWLEKPKTWEHIWWFFKTARAPISFDK